MKQLQWDKLPQHQVLKTLWSSEEPEKEQNMLKKLQLDGVWLEIEEDFKAKQLVINLMGVSYLFVNTFLTISDRSSEARGTQERT